MGSAKRFVKRATNSVKKTVSNPTRMLDPKRLAPFAPGMAAALGGMGAAGIGPKLGAGADGYVSSQGVNPGDGPVRESLRTADGKDLQEQFKYDPNKSGAFSKLKEQAMAEPGSSPWAKMQQQKQGVEQAGAADAAAKSSAQGLAQAQGNLMRQGGLGGGARTRMAMQGARDLAGAQQGVNRAGIQDRLGIQEQDINRTQDALGKVSSTELQGQGQNLATLQGDVKDKGLFDMEKYKQQMAVLGANKTANAQVAAANNSGKK